MTLIQYPGDRGRARRGAIPMRRVIGVVSAAILTLAACGGEDTVDTPPTSAAVSSITAPLVELGEGVAALVDGVAILTSDLQAISPEGATPNDVAANLRRLIIHRILEASVSELGLEVTAEDVATVRVRIVDEVTTNSGLPLEDVMAASGLNDAAFDLLVRQSALADAVEMFLSQNAPPPRDEDLQELFDDEVAFRTSVCSAHILLDTAAEAIAARDRALEGEDFGDLARELSTGPSGPNGGDLGCSNPSQFVQAFATATVEAEIGVAHGPVETEFGFHVILVTERVVPTLDDLREELTASLVGDVFPVWLTAEIEMVTVEVSSEFGTWVTDPSPAVLPPG